MVMVGDGEVDGEVEGEVEGDGASVGDAVGVDLVGVDPVGVDPVGVDPVGVGCGPDVQAVMINAAAVMRKRDRRRCAIGWAQPCGVSSSRPKNGCRAAGM